MGISVIGYLYTVRMVNLRCTFGISCEHPVSEIRNMALLFITSVEVKHVHALIHDLQFECVVPLHDEPA